MNKNCKCNCKIPGETNTKEQDTASKKEFDKKIEKKLVKDLEALIKKGFASQGIKWSPTKGIIK